MSTPAVQGDLFYIDVVAENAAVREFLTRKVKELLDDPSLDDALAALVSNEGVGNPGEPGSTATA